MPFMASTHANAYFQTMLNFYEFKRQEPMSHRLLTCGDLLITAYDCPLESRYTDLWSQHNYIVYVTQGKKTWHTTEGTYTLQQGDCVFIRKGASIVEQFFDASFCLILFFIPDTFICEALKSSTIRLDSPSNTYKRIIPVKASEQLNIFFQSMSSYFLHHAKPDASLLEIKFRELLLLVASNPVNGELLAYFCALLQGSRRVSLQRVMEENYCYNLKLEAYAQLCNRSLSAFKRDFQKCYDTTPRKWLLEKRLELAMQMLRNTEKNVMEVSFESGFENASHFSRCFKERFGISPIAARQQCLS